MKKLFLFTSILISLTSFSQGRQFVQLFSINANNWPGYSFPTLIDTPIGYNTNHNTYPLIVFLHGTGEASGTTTTDPNYVSGKTLSKIYGSSTAGGPAYYIANGLWPAYLEKQFIVASPQATGGSTTGDQLQFIISNMLAAGYRIDTNRIYLTGLSAGGQGLFDYVRLGVRRYYPAAVVPMSMAIGAPTNLDVAAFKNQNIAAWGFGSETDIYGIQTHLFIVGSYGGNNGPTPPGMGILGMITTYVGGHCCWGQFYDPNYKLNGLSIYDWMLTKSRSMTPIPPPIIVPPVVVDSAGIIKAYLAAHPCPLVDTIAIGKGYLLSHPCPVCPPPVICPVCPPQRNVVRFVNDFASKTCYFIFSDSTTQVILK